ncbi:MAG: hypothetical protein E7233_10075 [Lachnospiraceae bacterium]|nr:hypothetical protein [Lachnospiraceae bacterium]
MIVEKDNKWIWDIAFTVIGCTVGVFLLWKCRYGYANMDEVFYLLTPYRLCQGDALFAGEWHLSQMSAFLLYPVMKIYLMLGGGFERICLNFRYIYTIIHTLVSAFVYIRLRPVCRTGAAASCLTLLLYAPFGIMALSYNSMGIDFLTASLVIMCTAKRGKRAQEILAGFLFAAAVLCCPYLIAAFVIYLIACIVVPILRKKYGAEPDPVFNIKSWIFYTIGAVILAFIFAAFVFSRASLEQILASMPHILNDTAHESKGFFTMIITYFGSVLKLSKAADLCYALLLALAVLALIDKKSKDRAHMYIAAATVFTVVAIVFMVWYGTYINFVMYPITLMAPVCAAVNRSGSAKKLFFGFWIPGMLYTFCIHASSNMEYYAISSAAAVAVVPSMMIIAISARDFMRSRRDAAGYAAVVIAVILSVGQILTVGYMRYRTVFWGSMDDLIETEEKEGIEKGLFISPEAKKQQDMADEAAAYIEEIMPGEGNLLVMSTQNSLYLQCPDKKNASISGWIMELDGTISRNTCDRLLAYYEINPQKIPDIIYVYKDYAEYIEDLNTVADYEIVKEDWGALILVRK